MRCLVVGVGVVFGGRGGCGSLTCAVFLISLTSLFSSSMSLSR